MLAVVLMIMVLSSPNLNVVVTPGILNDIPAGYVVSNLDPTFNSTFNNEIYDPNFLPGFAVGLTNTSLSWTSGPGYGRVEYMIGPWTHEEVALPHFAVGPQCCNFVEVPHTQQFRRVEWGDYYYVRAGFGPPGINSENVTTDFKSPADIGLRTDWNWGVQIALDWKDPVMMNPNNQWGAIRLVITQYVPNAPGNLVSTLINFWMDSNSSKIITPATNGIGREVIHPNLVGYHPIQMSGQGNQTITVNISPYLKDTLQVLGLLNDYQPPVISYTYLNVEGYNFGWNTTLWSFKVFAQPTGSTIYFPVVPAIEGSAIAAVASALFYLDWRKNAALRRRERRSTGQ